MTQFDPQSFEAELERLKPCAPPAPLMTRLREGSPPPPAWHSLVSARAVARQIWPRWVWWTAAATGAVVMAIALLVRDQPAPTVSPRPSAAPLATAAEPTLKADQVEIDQHLLSSFDAVASLPNGEPVRFHCREWMQEVTLRDSARGITIERQAPRLEVIPVRFETY